MKKIDKNQLKMDKEIISSLSSSELNKLKGGYPAPKSTREEWTICHRTEEHRETDGEFLHPDGCFESAFMCETVGMSECQTDCTQCDAGVESENEDECRPDSFGCPCHYPG